MRYVNLRFTYLRYEPPKYICFGCSLIPILHCTYCLIDIIHVCDYMKYVVRDYS